MFEQGEMMTEGEYQAPAETHPCWELDIDDGSDPDTLFCPYADASGRVLNCGCASAPKLYLTPPRFLITIRLSGTLVVDRNTTLAFAGVSPMLPTIFSLLVFPQTAYTRMSQHRHSRSQQCSC
ncbi:hypothetical protein C8Q74DRAFT_577577 [Fomes fomentarius]|nr:hypothetical protein C8Q74DRAFT_577577 [Fomes fomentarius]